MRQKKQRFGLTGGLETVKALFPSETELEVLEWEYLTIWNRLADCRCVLLHTQIQQLSCPPQIAVSDLVTYVITGGTLLCPLDAVLSKCTELLQMLGVKPVFRVPFGRLRLAAAERAHCALERDGSGMSDTVLRAGAGAVLQIRRGAVSCIVGSEMGKGPRCGIDPSAAGIPQSGVPAGCGTAGRMVSV